MIELDDRLTRLQACAREWAAEMRPFSLEVDQAPDTLRRHLDLPALSRVSRLQIPPRYNPDPLVLAGHRFYLMSALERVVFFEEGAWGDLGMMLGAPGAAMAGILVNELGDDEQREAFFGRLLERPTWTFFALTEPDTGSDAGGLRTRFIPAEGVGRLDGRKRFVGNAARGELGVVFARTGPGLLALVAVLVESTWTGFSAAPLRTSGVRGAELGEIVMDGVPVPPERVLGRHLPATRRGMHAWIRVFNHLRPAVATMGVGVARAAHDYVVQNRRRLGSDEHDRLDRMRCRIEEVRQLSRRAALAVDRDPDCGHLGSAAKVAAARLAEDCTAAAVGFFGPGALLDHPLLDKLSRDARSVEYMEGTTNVQLLNLSGVVLRDRAGPLPRGPAVSPGRAVTR